MSLQQLDDPLENQTNNTESMYALSPVCSNPTGGKSPSRSGSPSNMTVLHVDTLENKNGTELDDFQCENEQNKENDRQVLNKIETPKNTGQDLKLQDVVKDRPPCGKPVLNKYPCKLSTKLTSRYMSDQEEERKATSPETQISTPQTENPIDGYSFDNDACNKEIKHTSTEQPSESEAQFHIQQRQDTAIVFPCQFVTAMGMYGMGIIGTTGEEHETRIICTDARPSVHYARSPVGEVSQPLDNANHLTDGIRHSINGGGQSIDLCDSRPTEYSVHEEHIYNNVARSYQTQPQNCEDSNCGVRSAFMDCTGNVIIDPIPVRLPTIEETTHQDSECYNQHVIQPVTDIDWQREWQILRKEHAQLQRLYEEEERRSKALEQTVNRQEQTISLKERHIQELLTCISHYQNQATSLRNEIASLKPTNMLRNTQELAMARPSDSNNNVEQCEINMDSKQNFHVTPEITTQQERLKCNDFEKVNQEQCIQTLENEYKQEPAKSHKRHTVSTSPINVVHEPRSKKPRLEVPPFSKPDEKDENKSREKPLVKGNLSLPTPSVPELEQQKKCRKDQQKHEDTRSGSSQDIRSEKVEIVDGSQIYITRNELTTCVFKARESPSMLMRFLLDLFFKSETLANSSAAGRGHAKRPPLDTHITTNIIAFIKTKFPDVKDSALLQAINQKCTDARKKLKKPTPQSQ